MKTKALTEVIQFIRENGGRLANMSKQGDRLVSAIEKGKVNNDREAERFLYGYSTGSGAWRGFKYRLLKNIHPKAQTIDVDSADWSEYNKNRWRVYVGLAFGLTLYGSGYKQGGAECLERTLALAESTGLLEACIIILQFLRRKAAREGDARLYKEIQKELDFKQAALDAQMHAYQVLDQIYLYTNRQAIAPETTLLDYARDHLATIDANRKKYNTRELHRIYFLTGIIVATNSNDLDFATKVIEDNRAWLHNNVLPPEKNDVVRWQIQYAHILYQKHRTQEGLALASKAVELARIGSTSWFIAGRYVFLLAMQGKEYATAQKALAEMLGNEALKDGGNYQRIEELRIFEASLRLVLPETGQLTDSVFYVGGPFPVERFLRSVPEYRKDKRGYNVTILLIQYLWLLRDYESASSVANWDKLLEVSEGLRRYQPRHLNTRTQTYRSNCIISALVELSDSDFSPKAAREIIEKWRTRLERKAGEYKGTLETIEPIPYEAMLTMALETVQRHAKRQTGYRRAM